MVALHLDGAALGRAFDRPSPVWCTGWPRVRSTFTSLVHVLAAGSLDLHRRGAPRGQALVDQHIADASPRPWLARAAPPWCAAGSSGQPARAPVGALRILREDVASPWAVRDRTRSLAQRSSSSGGVNFPRWLCSRGRDREHSRPSGPPPARLRETSIEVKARKPSVDWIRVALFLLSAGVLYAGAFRFSGAVMPGTGAERLAATTILGTFCALLMLRVLGAAALLTPAPLTCVALLMGAGLFVVAGSSERIPMGTPPGRGVQRLLAIVGCAASMALLTGLLIQAWLYRTTAWDALWYHSLMTHSYVAQGSTTWLDIGVDYASGYPNAVELLAAWPCAVIRTTTFDDVGQLPFGVVGSALIVAWSS